MLRGAWVCQAIAAVTHDSGMSLIETVPDRV
jgi:hypothetical protein